MFKLILLAVALAASIVTVEKATTDPVTQRAAAGKAFREGFVKSLDGMTAGLSDAWGKPVRVKTVYWAVSTQPNESCLVVLGVGSKELAFVFLMDTKTGKMEMLPEDFVTESQIGKDGKELPY